MDKQAQSQNLTSVLDRLQLLKSRFMQSDVPSENVQDRRVAPKGSFVQKKPSLQKEYKLERSRKRMRMNSAESSYASSPSASSPPCLRCGVLETEIENLKKCIVHIESTLQEKKLEIAALRSRALSEKISNLQQSVYTKTEECEHLKKSNEDLMQKVENLRELNLALQQKRPAEPRFSFPEREGFPSSQHIATLNQSSGNKDGLFVRLLLRAVFPDGFGQYSVTGQPSRNPSGRGAGVPPSGQHVAKQALPKELKEWFGETMYVRYLYEGKTEHQARVKSQETKINELLRQAIKNEGRNNARKEARQQTSPIVE